MSTAAEVTLCLQRVQKVWDRGNHNAFTDLCRFQEQFWLVFREATNHVSDDGRIIVLCSSDGCDWTLAAEIAAAQTDLRDPKITVTPGGELMITCAGVLYSEAGHPHQSFLLFSTNGRDWSAPKPVGRLHDWLWRSRFIDGEGFAVAYCASAETTTLYKLFDHDDYRVWVDPLFSKASHGPGYPNEHDLFVNADGSMGCLLRRDADSGSAQLGRAEAPFLDWHWRDLGVRIGGPVVLSVATAGQPSALLSVVRLYAPVRTALCWLDVDGAQLREVLALPSAGDTSYAGLVQIDRRILCSYYSSHEGKTSIYLAELGLQ